MGHYRIRSGAEKRKCIGSAGAAAFSDALLIHFRFSVPFRSLKTEGKNSSVAPALLQRLSGQVDSRPLTGSVSCQ